MLIKLQTSLMLSFSFALFIEISSPIIGPRVKVTNTLAYYDMEFIVTAKSLIVQLKTFIVIGLILAAKFGPRNNQKIWLCNRVGIH